MIAELIAKIVADVSDLNKAEVALKQFEHNVQQTFKRAPSGAMRAEAAIGGAVQQLMAGDVGGAVESITRRLGNMGIIGGVALGVVAVGIAKAVQAAKEFDAILAQVESTLADVPSAAMGVDALQAKITETTTATQKMAEKMESGVVQVGHAFMQMPGNMAQLATGFLGGKGTEAAMQVYLQAIIKARTEQADLTLETQNSVAAMQAAGEAAKQTADMVTLQAKGDENLTAAEKARMEYAAEIQKIKSQDLAVLNTLQDTTNKIGVAERQRQLEARFHASEERKEAAAQTRDTKLGVAERGAGLAKETLTNEQAIASIKAMGLSSDEEKVALAEANVQHLQRQLALQSKMEESVKATTRVAIERAQAEEKGDAIRRTAAVLKPAFEQTQLSFKDLLSADPRGGSVARIEAHNAALRAQREMDLSASAAAGGFQEQAAIHLARAENIKAGIPLLKESEKNPELAFLTAVNSASVFQAMKQYLETIAKAVGVGGNPFLNK